MKFSWQLCNDTVLGTIDYIFGVTWITHADSSNLESRQYGGSALVWSRRSPFTECSCLIHQELHPSFLLNIFANKWYNSISVSTISIYTGQMLLFQMKQHNCGECRAQFTHKKDLVIHVQAKHVGQKFTCGDCGKEFHYKKSMDHMWPGFQVHIIP